MVLSHNKRCLKFGRIEFRILFLFWLPSHSFDQSTTLTNNLNVSVNLLRSKFHKHSQVNTKSQPQAEMKLNDTSSR